jgi:uroporphyrinogen-III synthase
LFVEQAAHHTAAEVRIVAVGRRTADRLRLLGCRKQHRIWHYPDFVSHNLDKT